MLSFPRRLPSRAALAAFIGLVFASAVSPGSALAQGKLEARYSATLAGLPIGKGSWTIEISDNSYTASVSGVATGLIRLLTNGHGNSSARGTLSAGKPVSAIYASTITSKKKADEVRLTLNGGTVKDFTLNPPDDENPERVKVTEAHRHGVMDPMSASLLRTPGSGDPVSPLACQRTLPVFDGRLRYDLQLTFKRMDNVKAEKGYAGPVVVCAVQFVPVAGYIPSRSTIKHLVAEKNIEVWLAPIAGTRVLVPFRMQGPTPIGEAVLEATHFISVPLPSRAAITSTKVQ